MELKKFRASYRFLPRVQNLFTHKLGKSIKKGGFNADRCYPTEI